MMLIIGLVVLIYCLLFADWKDERQPFYEVCLPNPLCTTHMSNFQTQFREWFWNSLGFKYEAPRPVPKVQSQESQTSVQAGSRTRQM